jgi:hypothetical protein
MDGTINTKELQDLCEANRRIEELEAAMMRCIESVRSIRWGYDGDGGASNAVEIMDDTLSEIRAKVIKNPLLVAE